MGGSSCLQARELRWIAKATKITDFVSAEKARLTQTEFSFGQASTLLNQQKLF